MDEAQALEILDNELSAGFTGVAAPDHFAADVRRRITAQRVSKLPEILDSIGWAAVLAIAFELITRAL